MKPETYKTTMAIISNYPWTGNRRRCRVLEEQQNVEANHQFPCHQEGEVRQVMLPISAKHHFRKCSANNDSKSKIPPKKKGKDSKEIHFACVSSQKDEQNAESHQYAPTCIK